MNINSGISKIPNILKGRNISFGAPPVAATATAATSVASTDTFERSVPIYKNGTAATEPISVVGQTVPLPKIANINEKMLGKYLHEITEEKILPEEILHFLQPKVDYQGNPCFTPRQAKIIETAVKRMKLYKNISKDLEAEAISAKPIVLAQMKEVFGGDKDLGKYIVIRTKNKQSIFKKLVKEYNNEHFYGKFMDTFSQKAFKKPYKKLDKDEKELIKMSIKSGELKLEKEDYDFIANVLKPTKKARIKATNYVKDLVGTRLILPTGNSEEMKKVEKYLTKAIFARDIDVTRMSNYHANHILPYIKYDVAKSWRDEVPGLLLVENSAVRKRNGYTTTQLNINHPVKIKEYQITGKNSKKITDSGNYKESEKTVLGEFQIRTEKLNYIGQVEHLIYDILEGKDISNGIPELKKYYDSIGIEKAVDEVFNDEKKENSYTDYEKSMYAWVRNNETTNDEKHQYEKPILASFNLGEYAHLLSFTSLARIDEEADLIKKKFTKKN